MATRFSNTLQMTNSTDALFRAWVQFVEDTLVTTGGWVNTADTGQMTISTAAHPTLTQTKVGYRVYRMADTLQATKPIYMRIDYGSGTAANTPAMWPTIGTGTDGAGNVTGTIFAPVGPGGGSTAPVVANTNGTNASSSYGSADTNRLQLLMFVRGGANDFLLFSVERSKDSSGNDTGDGLLITWQTGSGAGSGIDRSAYVLAVAGTQPAVENGCQVVLSNNDPSTFSGDVGIGLVLHVKSVVQQPGLGVCAANSNDFVANAQPSFSIYGASHTFQLGSSSSSQIQIPTGNGAATARSQTRIGIRYE